MADDDDDEISGQVVGAMRREVEVANRAIIVHLEECAKQLAFAAARAAAAKAALYRSPHITLFSDRGFPGPDFGGCGGGYHDLPFFDLPGFRTFFRGVRPGWAFA